MRKLRIALVSDLHVGTNARGLDICPLPIADDAKIGKKDDYVGIFERTAAEFLASGRIDILCVTGDITNTGHASEFSSASRAIGRIATALDVAEHRVFFSPGNHDVNWPVMKLSPESFWSAHRYSPMLQDELIFQRRLADAIAGRIDTHPYYVVWDSPEALVASVNSAAYDGPNAAPHSGEIRQETIDDLRRFLSGMERDSNKIRMCLLHHHPIQYSEPIPDTPDQSIIVNAENFLNLISEQQFDIILHGHKHHPRLKTHQGDNSNPFVSLCAGSFSATLNSLQSGTISNLFHIINIESRHPASGGIQGYVETWSFRTEGKWQVSHQLHGIHPREAFGTSASVGEIENRIRTILTSFVQTARNCAWSDIITADPELDFVRTDVAFGAFTRMSVEQGYEVAGDKHVATRTWVAYGRKQP